MNGIPAMGLFTPAKLPPVLAASLSQDDTGKLVNQVVNPHRMLMPCLSVTDKEIASSQSDGYRILQNLKLGCEPF